jgi:hypothetical protein
MASLTGNLISDSYQGLLKTSDNGPISSTLKNITDGNGNSTALFVSTLGTAISGSFTVTGSMIISGTLAATSSNATSASYAVTSSLAVSASNANFLDGLDSTAFVVVSGSNVMTGSINLDGTLSFTSYSSMFVLPTTPAPIPVVGSAYFEPTSGSLYIYNGSTYLSVALS